MRKWRIEDSNELYGISGWGVNYFHINEKGNVAVTPRKDSVEVDLKEVMDDLALRDVSAPVLVRFPDIIDNLLSGDFTHVADVLKEARDLRDEFGPCI